MGEEEKDVLIRAEHLSKEYKLGKVIDDVSFELKKGHIYGLVGPNGAGKTTIMKMLGGLTVPTGGTVVMYEDGQAVDAGLARAKMSFMIEQPYLQLGKNAYFNLEKQRLMRGIADKSAPEKALAAVGLGDVSKKKIVRKYSLGMKQRLGLAIAIMSEPQCMVLDEPVNGLDPEGIVEIRELLLQYNREHETTILISSHILGELAHLCTDYIFINHGKIVKTLTEAELQTVGHGDLEAYYLEIITGKEQG